MFLFVKTNIRVSTDKEKENNTAIDIFMLLKKYDVLRKIIKVVSGKEPRGLLIVDSIKLFNHYSKLYKEIKKMI